MKTDNTNNDDIRAMTISETSRTTGFCRDTIRNAMNLYESSKGAFGLPFMRATKCERRRSRKSMVIEWMSRMERSAARR